MNTATDTATVAADATFEQWMLAGQARCESALDRFLPDAALLPGRLHEAMRYAAMGGGKRVRPLLVYATAELIGSDNNADSLDRAACAVEMIHAYSLVHDDLPCMDDDDLRRGKPTVHRAFDEATAMLVGDGLQALAFETLSAVGDPVAAVATRELAVAAGSAGMVGGQMIDLMAVGQQIDREALEQMHRRKTGAMLNVSVRLGYIAAAQHTKVPAELDAFADAIGLAFQVVDDILDVESDSATLGKTAGKDAANNKPTYVSLLGLEPARALAGELHVAATRALDSLGANTRRLHELADLIVLRKH